MRRSGRLAAALSIAGSVLALPQMALAGDDIRASADVTTTGGYSSNPFAVAGNNLGSSYVQVDARPEVRLIAERSVLSLTGRIDYEHYFRDYFDASDYQGGLNYSGTLSSHMATHASVIYDSSIVGGYDAINSFDPTLAQPLPTTGTDLALFGSRQRRRSLDFAGDVAYTLSPRDSLTANAYFDALRYGGVLAGQADYNGYGGGAGYSRRVSERLQLGAQASVGRYVYHGLLGHSEVYSLQATITDQINSHWNLTGSLGASYSQRTIGGKTISPTGNLQLCRVGTRGNLCASVRESVLPTGGTGTVVTRSANASYSYKLSEHSDISLSGSYSHNNQPPVAIPSNVLVFNTSYVTAMATYSRSLRERVRLVATTQFRTITGGNSSVGNGTNQIGNRPADFGASLGILVRLGDYR